MGELVKRVKLSSPHFQGVTYRSKLYLTMDNSEDAMDNGGSDVFELIYDIKNNELLALKGNESNEDTSKRFSDSYALGMPEWYEENQSFEGCYYLKSEDGVWSMEFQGGHMGTTGKIKSTIEKQLISELTKEAMYKFLDDAIYAISKI